MLQLFENGQKMCFFFFKKMPLKGIMSKGYKFSFDESRLKNKKNESLDDPIGLDIAELQQFEFEYSYQSLALGYFCYLNGMRFPKSP